MSDKVRVLLVENEYDIVSVFTRGLEFYGYEVAAFVDPIKALYSFKANQHDIALLDIRMPDMSGIELAKELLKKEPTLTILFWSAYEYDEPTIKARVPNLIDGFFIRKPCSLGDLVMHIRRNYSKPAQTKLAQSS